MSPNLVEIGVTPTKRKTLVLGVSFCKIKPYSEMERVLKVFSQLGICSKMTYQQYDATSD